MSKFVTATKKQHMHKRYLLNVRDRIIIKFDNKCNQIDASFGEKSEENCHIPKQIIKGRSFMNMMETKIKFISRFISLTHRCGIAHSVVLNEKYHLKIQRNFFTLPFS